MGKVYGLWHGGSSYAPAFDTADMIERLEVWPGIKAAGETLQDRELHNSGAYPQSVTLANMTAHEYNDRGASSCRDSSCVCPYSTVDPACEGTCHTSHRVSTLMPCVEGSHIDLYHVSMDEAGRLVPGEPYLRLELGPRGGVHRESF